ncbi:dTDP-glucose 4,6-dehydratase [uncultured Paenibacillus sp.]|uniref:dTDP-glucose 4,6-dehydratase n=1 Tax=uncultured Paenibacillus sp. TaxID=227322 RepID=UPI0015B0DE57|nr:dTDP-glucose 4,6-dehydratase [uncultured Paenibacillus sp.]
MKLLVTGGAGFIGSNFVRYMLKRHPNYRVVNVDALTYAGNLENLQPVENHPNYTFVQADITDAAMMDALVRQDIDVIVNFAAESHVDRSIVEPDVFVKTNVLGTQVLLDAARKYNVAKYVQISTDEVYGSLGEKGLFTEETPLSPNSPYSASKAGSDLLVRAYHETYGLPVNITRCSNNYGPYQFPEKLIPFMISKALAGEELPVYGDGLNIRDWLYVEDHCSAVDLVIHQGRNGEIYNIGGNNERTNLDIVRTLLKQLGKPESLITFVQDRPGHDRRYGIDPAKTMSELGWKPKYSFETGIVETIRWYLEHQEWWTRIQNGAYRTYVPSIRSESGSGREDS